MRMLSIAHSSQPFPLLSSCFHRRTVLAVLACEGRLTLTVLAVLNSTIKLHSLTTVAINKTKCSHTIVCHQLQRSKIHTVIDFVFQKHVVSRVSRLTVPVSSYLNLENDRPSQSINNHTTVEHRYSTAHVQSVNKIE